MSVKMAKLTTNVVKVFEARKESATMLQSHHLGRLEGKSDVGKGVRREVFAFVKWTR